MMMVSFLRANFGSGYLDVGFAANTGVLMRMDLWRMLPGLLVIVFVVMLLAS